MEEKNLLSVKNLEVKYFLRNSTVEAVNDISFHIGRGESWPCGRNRRWKDNNSFIYYGPNP